jgi:hypothetical protein
MQDNAALLRVTSRRSRDPLLTVTRSSDYRETYQRTVRSEGRGGKARLGSAPLLLRSRVPRGFCPSTSPAWGEYATLLPP